jgi:hypothetical protein
MSRFGREREHLMSIPSKIREVGDRTDLADPIRGETRQMSGGSWHDTADVDIVRITAAASAARRVLDPLAGRRVRPGGAVIHGGHSVRRVLRVVWHVYDAAYPQFANVTYIAVLDPVEVTDDDLRGLARAHLGGGSVGITLLSSEPIEDSPPLAECNWFQFDDGARFAVWGWDRLPEKEPRWRRDVA